MPAAGIGRPRGGDCCRCCCDCGSRGDGCCLPPTTGEVPGRRSTVSATWPLRRSAVPGRKGTMAPWPAAAAPKLVNLRKGGKPEVVKICLDQDSHTLRPHAGYPHLNTHT